MPPDPTPQMMQFIDRFGFPAFVTVCLGLFMWKSGREITSELGRLTRAVTLMVLAMQFAPQFHEAANELYEDSLEASKRRKDKPGHERQKPPRA